MCVRAWCVPAPALPALSALPAASICVLFRQLPTIQGMSRLLRAPSLGPAPISWRTCQLRMIIHGLTMLLYHLVCASTLSRCVVIFRTSVCTCADAFWILLESVWMYVRVCVLVCLCVCVYVCVCNRANKTRRGVHSVIRFRGSRQHCNKYSTTVFRQYHEGLWAAPRGAELLLGSSETLQKASRRSKIALVRIREVSWTLQNDSPPAPIDITDVIFVTFIFQKSTLVTVIC